MGKYYNNRLFKAWASMPSQSAITAGWNARQIAAANSRRISQLSKQVRRNTSETKCVQNSWISSTLADGAATVIELTSIAQGDDSFHRDGNVIHITGIDIRGHIVDRHLDIYFILAPNGATPNYGSFMNRQGGFLYSTERNNFKVIKWIHNFNGNGDISFSRKLNIPVYYNGSASGNGVRNRMYLVIKNDTGFTSGGQLVTQLWFKDK